MNQITNHPNSIALTLLKLSPIFGIALLSLIYALNALSGVGILLSVLLVSVICSILIIFENIAEEETTSLVIQFFVMLNAWFITYPVYFLQKEEREKQGHFSLIAAAMTFILIIGFGELYRLGLLKSTNENLAQLVNLLLVSLIAILIYSAPIVFANVFNSIKKSFAIILALIAFALVLVPTLVDASPYISLSLSFTSLIAYIFALRMAFKRANLNNTK
jgi:hypothetical protein